MKAAIFLLAFAALCTVGANAYRDLDHLYADDPVYNTYCSAPALAMSGEDEKAYILKKFEVLPSKQDDFLKIANKAKEELQKLDSVEHACLSKIKTDNLFYVSVAVFDSWQSYCEFLKSDVAKKLKQCLNENDIKEFWVPLKLIHKVD